MWRGSYKPSCASFLSYQQTQPIMHPTFSSRNGYIVGYLQTPTIHKDTNKMVLSTLCICLVCISLGYEVRKWALRVYSDIIRQRHHWQNNTPNTSGTTAFPHSVARQTGTNMGGEEKCINVQIAFIKLCHTASGLAVKDLCLALQRLVPFLACQDKKKGY